MRQHFPELSVAVQRGTLVESRHIAYAVSVADGRIVESAGDPELVTHMRSAAKPLQALPLALDCPDLPAEELAIACASHESRDEQLAAVTSLLARAEASVDELECGPHEGSRLRNNCSGKHAGMLLRARLHGWPREGYRLAGHPLQNGLLELVADAADLKPAEIETAVDGCGVVCFGMPLWRMALMFSRLVRDELDGSTAVVAAMRSHPDLVGGPEADDSTLMRALPGSVAKHGAEGVLCAGLPDGTGVALKILDGAKRAAGPALGAYLGVDELRGGEVRNTRGEPVGSISAGSGQNRSGAFPQAL